MHLNNSLFSTYLLFTHGEQISMETEEMRQLLHQINIKLKR